MPQRVLLVDGMALLFRHFYATSLHNQFMYNSKGIPTNGIQGFVRHIFSAIKEIEPTHVAVCWDMGQETFRNEMYDAINKIAQHLLMNLFLNLIMLKKYPISLVL